VHRAATRHNSVRGSYNVRDGQSILHAWNELGSNFDSALGSLNASEQHVRAAQADLVAAGARLQTECVGNRYLSVVGRENSSQYQGVANIVAFGLEGSRRA